MFKISVIKLLIFEICIVIILLTNNSDGRSHSRNSILPSSVEIIESRNSSTSFSEYLNPAIKVIERAMNVLPSPKQILNYGKQTLIGIPQEIAVNTKRFLCSKAVQVHLNDIQKEFHPNVEDLNYLFLTDDRDNVTISLSNSEYLFNHPKFHMNWNVVLFVSGWNLNTIQTNETISALYEAYKCRTGYNFVVLDTSKFVNSVRSEISTEPIGEVIGDAIVELTRFIPYERFHVIGHGIGSHIAGTAGRHFTKISSKALPRITGIDPSRPCYSESDRANGLQRGDALFVDILHSNTESLRSSDPIGDIDIYTNGPKIVQSGCWSISCSSVMAYQFYAETIYPGNEYLFNATRCESFGLFRLGSCRDKADERLQIPFGFATPSWARGQFYLTSPFVQNRQKKQCQHKQLMFTFK